MTPKWIQHETCRPTPRPSEASLVLVQGPVSILFDPVENSDIIFVRFLGELLSSSSVNNGDQLLLLSQTSRVEQIIENSCSLTRSKEFFGLSALQLGQTIVLSEIYGRSLDLRPPPEKY